MSRRLILLNMAGLSAYCRIIEHEEQFHFLNVSGCSFIYDMRDVQGVAAGAVVNTLPDASGNDLHVPRSAGAPTLEANALGGHPALVCDGAQEFSRPDTPLSSLSSEGSVSYFFLGRLDNKEAYLTETKQNPNADGTQYSQIRIPFTGNSEFRYAYFQHGGRSSEYTGPSGIQVVMPFDYVGQYMLLEFHRNISTGEVYHNGVLLASGAMPNMLDVEKLGNFRLLMTLQGRFLAFVGYGRYLSEEERMYVRAGIAATWGLEVQGV